MRILIVDSSEHDCKQIKKELEIYDQMTNNISYIDQALSLKHIQQSYDIYLITTSSQYLNTNKKEITSLRMNEPEAYIICLSDEDDLIFEIQSIHPFYFVRKSNLKHDLYKAMDMVNNERTKNYLYVEKKGRSLSIDVDDIFSVEINDHYLMLYTAKDEYVIRKTINEFVEEYHFVRINRSVAINPKYIIKRIKNIIVLSNHKEYKVSPKYD